MEYPYGVVEDVLVRIAKFVFPVNFVVKDIEVPFILGRPFRKTTKIIIDVDEGKLKVRVKDDEVNFNVFEATQHPKDKQQQHDKLKDLDTFNILVTIGTLPVGKALLYFGVCINLISLSMLKRIKDLEVRST